MTHGPELVTADHIARVRAIRRETNLGYYALTGNTRQARSIMRTVAARAMGIAHDPPERAVDILADVFWADPDTCHVCGDPRGCRPDGACPPALAFSASQEAE